MTVTKRQTFIPALSYQDPIAALKWLERAFGFETAMLIMGQSGVYRADEFHAEMRLGDGIVMIGGEWTDTHKSPKSAGGLTTQTVHVHLDEDIDAYLDAWNIHNAEQRSYLRRIGLTPGAGGLREIRQIISHASMLAMDDHSALTLEHLRESLSTRATRHLRLQT